ncbi:MAG TPA: glycosyltransferase [Stellaceae bacterium]|nr:glycosyltransferase [Stellaceae bacterium]
MIGIEIAGASGTYAWARTERVEGFERRTLFPDRRDSEIPWWRQFARLARVCLGSGARHVFICHYDHLETLLLAILLRLMGCRLTVMVESKFDDKPRRLGLEFLKSLVLLPYGSGMVGGERSRDYLRLYGFRADRVALGYDTVSIERVRALAGGPPAPDGVPFSERHFTIVARLVRKKNIAMALDAYARYCRAAGPAARALHICGDGPLMPDLTRQAKALGLEKVVFRGFVQAPEVAQELAGSLALILPSTEEQWGLVINEALAMGLPVLCSTNVGARDLLVRTAVNGYIFEPDNPTGLAALMAELSENEALWHRLAQGSLALAPLADTRHFADAATRLVSAAPLTSRAPERPSVPDPAP